MGHHYYFVHGVTELHHGMAGWGKSLLLRSLPPQIALLTVIFASSGFAADALKEFVPRGTIVDADQKPIPGAQITLHRWDGAVSPALQTATTDGDGHFQFPSRKEDAYYYIVVRKEPFARIMPIVSPEGPIKATLHPAVNTWIEVRSQAGEVLKGARIADLSIRTPENTQTYVWRGMEHLLGFEFKPSDDAGRLNLPPLPVGALVDIRIDHPRWAQARLSNAKVAEGRLGSVALARGVMMTFQFTPDSRTPMTVDGLTCEATLLSKSSNSAETLLRVPMTIVGDQIDLCAHPVTYDSVIFKAPGMIITPVLNRLTIAPGAEKKVRFLVRKTVNVSGRVVRRDGTPHKGAEIYGEVENLSPEGLLPEAERWINCARAETDAEGKFTLRLPPGHARVHAQAEGFVTNRDYTEFEVRVEGSNEVPDFVAESLEPVRGQIVDANGSPLPGAIVRLRGGTLFRMQPVVSDAEGRFEIALSSAPIDPDTRQRLYKLNVAAFLADQPLMGLAGVDLRNRESLQNVRIVLHPEPSPDALLSMEDNRWSLAKKRKALAEDFEKHPAGERGQPPPELDGIDWFNTDARSLKDLRGRYVLLDFWFIGCGPCHGDFPSVKLVHERFEKHGVTVIGVHDNSSTPEAVREHCRQQGLTFPIVVDHPDGRILDAYRKLGVQGFPTYILIGPDGNILENDSVTDGPLLRLFKIELVRKFVLDRQH